MKRLASRTQQTLFKLLLHLQPAPRSEGGYIIVVVAGMIVAISAMLLSAELLGRVDSSSTKSSGNSSAGFYAAEAGLNLRAKEIGAKFRGYNVPRGTSPTDRSCRGASSTKGTYDLACDNSLTIQDYLYPNDSTKKISVSTYVIDATRKDSSGNPDPEIVNIDSGEQFAGLNAQEYRYDVNSVAYDRGSGQPSAITGLRFKSRLVPLFQFAAFYDKDLEILPGPTMLLSGPVHTNGDLYTNSGDTLTYKGQITVHGSLYRGRKNDNTCAGTVKVYDGSSDRAMSCVGSTRSNITNVSSWNQRIRLGVPTVTVPPPESFDPVSTSNYWSKADLRVVLKLDSSGNPDITNTDGFIQVRNADGSVDSARTNKLMNSCSATNTTLSSNVNATSTTINVASATGFSVGDVIQIGKNDSNVISSISSNTITLKRTLGNNSQTGNVALTGADVRKAVVSTSNRFYNFREGKYIRMLNVDVQGLLNCAKQQNLLDSSRALSDTTEGGLVWFLTVDGPQSLIDVYSGDTDPSDGLTPSGGNNYAVRLYNGGTLQSSVSGAPAIQGLSVVSDQAAYIQGEYNCGTWDSTTSTCSYKKPAAVMADSINVLSNNWKMDDSNTLSTYPANMTSCNQPGASNTRINAAFLTGTDVTGRQEGSGGQGGGNATYNGGLENYPRFHENWGSIELRYRGSFVSLNKTRRVSGKWSDQCYSAPGRNWNYDTDFNNAANLPPLSPRFVYLRQERFSRDYTRTSFLPLSSPFASFFPTNLFVTLPTAIGGQFIF
jgi:hypothetical protein